MKKLNIIFCLATAVFLFSKCGDDTFPEGKSLYKIHCENCHMENGEGLVGLIPPLAGADFLDKKWRDLPCILRNGLESEITVNGKIYQEKMPAMPLLTEFEMTNILNYIGRTWGNNLTVWTVEEVRANLERCKTVFLPGEKPLY